MAKYNVNIDYANDVISDSTSIKEMEDIFPNVRKVKKRFVLE